MRRWNVSRTSRTGTFLVTMIRSARVRLQPGSRPAVHDDQRRADRNQACHLLMTQQPAQRFAMDDRAHQHASWTDGKDPRVMMLAPVLTPHGLLTLRQTGETVVVDVA